MVIRIKKAFPDLHEEKSNNERGSLTISDLSIVDGISLHHVEEGLLAHPVLLLEELVLRVGPRDVPANHLKQKINRVKNRVYHRS